MSLIFGKMDSKDSIEKNLLFYYLFLSQFKIKILLFKFQNLILFKVLSEKLFKFLIF